VGGVFDFPLRIADSLLGKRGRTAWIRGKALDSTGKLERRYLGCYGVVVVCFSWLYRFVKAFH
jgi:hypothetical protein